VYVEKPLTPSFADSRGLVDHARRAMRKLTIGYSYYFDPALASLHEMCARGELGDPVHVESFLGYSLASPYGKAILADGDHWVRRLPGKLFHNNFDHVLCEIARYLPDPRPEEQFEADPLGDVRISAQGWIRRA
jgi:hypothetical protein